MAVQEPAWSFMHRSNCSDNGKRSISEARGAQSGNGSSDNQHGGRPSYTTDYGPEFENTEKSNEGNLGKISTSN